MDRPSEERIQDLLEANNALLERARKAEAANERWRQNSADTWSAMLTMRNDINEHIPMPSLESDLLQGPENSVFCAAVAQAVLFEVHRLRSLVALGELSISSLARKVKKVEGVSKSRLIRMKQRGKVLIQTRALLARMNKETHGG